MTIPKKPENLTATEALSAIKADKLSSEALIQSCFARIDQRDSDVCAWECTNRELSLKQARELDLQERTKALHGIPIGVKDIIETDELPTGNGSPIFSGQQSKQNADCVNRLKEAGAIVLGKTVTTEFAFLNPGKTRNPHNIQHTPGGSSSGSAAAIADMQVPLALGTQTAGSIIRPASYCGVVGFKPSFDSFVVQGIHPFAPSLDTLGGFARSVSDIILLRNVLADEVINIEIQKPSSIALIRGPYWQDADDETVQMFEQLGEILRQAKIEFSLVELEQTFTLINDAQTKIQIRECTETLKEYYLNHKEALSTKLLEAYESGLALSESEMKDAYTCVEKCRKLIEEVNSQYQIILTPASPGSAPKGLSATGDPVFNRMWTALGMPCISPPFPRKEGELPLGMQMVGRPNGDVDLLAHASWLELLLENS